MPGLTLRRGQRRNGDRHGLGSGRGGGRSGGGSRPEGFQVVEEHFRHRTRRPAAEAVWPSPEACRDSRDHRHLGQRQGVQRRLEYRRGRSDQCLQVLWRLR